MDVVPSLTAEDVRDYATNNYTGENIVVVATGNVNHTEVVDEV